MSANHVQELMEMFAKTDLENYPFDDQQAENSTSFDEEEEEKERKKRKRKRRKLKDSDFSNDLEEVVARLNEMVILKEKRVNCQASEQWAISLKQRYQ
jgi:hypothetical protein